MNNPLTLEELRDLDKAYELRHAGAFAYYQIEAERFEKVLRALHELLQIREAIHRAGLPIIVKSMTPEERADFRREWEGRP